MLKITLICLMISLSQMVTAARWSTNKDHSELMFQVPYMGVSELTGRFNEFTGEIRFAEDGKTAQELKIRIEAASIDTGNKMRDGHLRGSDFLQSGHHPEISFTSTNITTLKLRVYRATGDLTIKGMTQRQTVEFTTTDSVKDTWGYDNRFVKFKSSLNRKDYRINWNKTLDGKEFLVGDVITFWGTFQLQPALGKTPNSKHMIPDTEHIRQRDRSRREALDSKEGESSFSRKLRNLINGK